MQSIRSLFTKTINHMEAIINNNEQQEQKSQFCETLMKVTGAIGHLANPGDTAIVLCSDGKAVSSRQCGLYPDVLNMVYVKMLNDDSFAELIVESAMMYSRYLQEAGGHGRESDSREGESESLIDFK